MSKIFGVFVPVGRLGLVLGELVFAGCALYFLLIPFLVSSLTLYPVAGPAAISIILSGIGILTMLATGLYNTYDFQNYRATAAKALLTAFLLGPLIFVVCLTLSRAKVGGGGISAFWYLKATTIWFVCIAVARLSFMRLMRLDALKRRVIVIGAGTCARNVAEIGASYAAQHCALLAFVKTPTEKTLLCADHMIVDAESENLLTLARRLRATEIVVAVDDRRGLPTEQLLQCKIAGIRVTDYLSFCERESGRVDLAALQPSWLIYSDGFRTGLVFRVVKRIFDMAASIAVLILTLPVLIVTALLIAIESHGPILYRQERVGQFGRPFVLLKFRSMRVDAEQNGNPQWAAKHDPRVTRIGAWIRKVRIDELPQLINVLKGDMSFIGPRPERPYFVNRLEEKIRFYGERHAVKPGISGWAQINYPYGASLDDARKKLEFDLFYVKNTTLLLDFIIFIRTVRVILNPEGAR